MNPTLQKILQPSFLLTLAAAIKLILQPFGIQISDAEENTVVNVICGVATVYGLWKDHGNKTKAAPSSSLTPTDFQMLLQKHLAAHRAIMEPEQAPVIPASDPVIVDATTQFPDKP